MMHRAWSSIVEVPYCFSRSYVKFQGHTALKIVEFHPNWAFPDCNSSLNSPMAMKCCTKLETAQERCPIVFQGHPSNFKVTRYKTSSILTQIGRFQTIGRSQLSNPSDLPCCLEINFAILHCILSLESIIFWTAFVAVFTIFLHYWHKFFCLLLLSHTCPLSLVTLEILSNVVWRWQNWFVVSQGSTWSPYSYDFPEHFV